MKLYKYTIYKQDGTIEVLPVSKEKDFKELYKILGCDMPESIPPAYYPEGFGDVIVYGDEEGRFKESNHRNPHFKVLKGNVLIGEPREWDIVGDVIKQEEVKS